MLVKSTSAYAINTGDVCKLISTPGKNKAISIKKQTAFSNKVTMNGKTHRECIHNVMHCITKSSCSSLYSLVHRVANGTVARSDVRFIETRPDSKVFIRSMDDHELTVIPLVTAG